MLSKGLWFFLFSTNDFLAIDDLIFTPNTTSRTTSILRLSHCLPSCLPAISRFPLYTHCLFSRSDSLKFLYRATLSFSPPFPITRTMRYTSKYRSDIGGPNCFGEVAAAVFSFHRQSTNKEMKNVRFYSMGMDIGGFGIWLNGKDDDSGLQLMMIARFFSLSLFLFSSTFQSRFPLKKWMLYGFLCAVRPVDTLRDVPTPRAHGSWNGMKNNIRRGNGGNQKNWTF